MKSIFIIRVSNNTLRKELFDLRSQMDGINSKLATITRKISSSNKQKHQIQTLYNQYSQQVNTLQNAVDHAVQSDTTLLSVAMSGLKQSVEALEDKYKRDYRVLSDQVKVIASWMNKHNNEQLGNIQSNIDAMARDISELKATLNTQETQRHEQKSIRNIQNQLEKIYEERDSLRESHQIVTNFFNGLHFNNSETPSKALSVTDDTITYSQSDLNARNESHECYMVLLNKSNRLISLKLKPDRLLVGELPVAYDDILRVDDEKSANARDGLDCRMSIFTNKYGTIVLQAQSKEDKSNWISKIWDHVIFKSCAVCFS
eukprot:242051_1